jgi:exodeoxyribonuclease VII large subunit
MNPLTISALTTHIVSLFDRDEILRDVWVTGEVSSWKRAASGHIYFSLKDSSATINAVMWRGSARTQTWLPAAGDQVLAHGYVGIYPERGAYQLYVNQIRPAGRGQLYAQFEALKRRLAEAGLFDEERKRPIPVQPRRMGVVTSADAAALRDILRVLSQRWPLVDVVVFPTLVQGNEAPAQIEGALATANYYDAAVESLDVIILARGGGSIEDLWAFNDERVAQAVADSVVPVICGVGHETDFTIADFVADLRAPTPSAAAAAAVPDRAEAAEALAATRRWLANQAQARLERERARLGQLVRRLERTHPQRRLDLQRQRLDERQIRLHGIMDRLLERERAGVLAARQRLDALNPTGVLARGYSIVRNQEGQVITAPEQVTPGESLRVHAAGGEYGVTASELKVV